MDDAALSFLESIDKKVDRLLELGERVSSQETLTSALEGRMSDVEETQNTQGLEMATMRGRHQVIVWVLGVIGGPTVVALVVAGVSKLMGVHG